MNSLVDLVWLESAGDSLECPKWKLGQSVSIKSSVKAVHELIHSRLPESNAKAWLFWDSSIGIPDENAIIQALETIGDVWHSGLKLGLKGKPSMLDFIQPTWMLHLDPDLNKIATSWRISLRSALISTDVLRQLGGPLPNFSSLDIASLELGHRYLTSGVIVRYMPSLITNANGNNERYSFNIDDELRFILYRFGPRWAFYAISRACMLHMVSVQEAFVSWMRVRKDDQKISFTPYQRNWASVTKKNFLLKNLKVTVLIPTLDRYPFLVNELFQLRYQTVKPHEIIIIDQTPSQRRRNDWIGEFQDLPIKYIQQDKRGQSFAWNAGIKLSTGDYVILLGDDADRITPTFVEDLLESCNTYNADVIATLVEEKGAEEQIKGRDFVKISDILPISLLKKEVFIDVGLYDLAYNKGARADADLAIRLYRNGKLLIFDPKISIFHHRAPSGGLRTHSARKITFSSSRKYLSHRHLPSTTEIYLAKRFFTPRQVQEMLLLRLLGTFAISGPWWKKIAKIFISGFLLPNSLWIVMKRVSEANKMLNDGYPIIPQLKQINDF